MAVQPDVVYRYYLTDLLTNKVIAEVPFRGVSFGRTNRRAGEFSGSIAFDEATRGLNLYEATMPGKTGIYIMRNETCIWGGIVWSRSYNAQDRILEVNGAEFISYLYHRNVWQTLQYGSNFIGVAAYQVEEGFCTIITETPHGFVVGDMVRVTFTNSAINGDQQVFSVPSSNEFIFTTDRENIPLQSSTSGACRSLVDTYDFARDLLRKISNDFSGINFSNEIIKPGKSFELGVISREITNGIARIQTDQDHQLIVGQEIELVEVGGGLDGNWTVLRVPNSRTVMFECSLADSARTEISGIRILNVLSKRLSGGIGTLVLDGPHNSFPGQTVFLENIDSFFTGRLETTFNGRFTVASTPDVNVFTISTGGLIDTDTAPVSGGTASFGAKLFYGEYGGFTSNSDIQIAFENEDKSGFYQDQQVYRGFEQRSVGEILEVYSNVVEGGFEYRIDCDYDYTLGEFTRTFKFIPIELDVEPPPPGEVYPVTAFQADKIVFEYPGNIINLTIEENAEESATRFFVVGKVEDLGDEASQPYSGASALDLLSNSSGDNWPILDVSESLDKVEDELDLYNYAKDYLYEARPPIGTINVSVNGSLEPVVGSYFPGQWCSLIIDDEFVRERLANDQEPRDDLLIRKIVSYKVTVSDNPVYPETVDLELSTDWKVDQRGN